jgi:hypothetical protein
VTSANGDGSTAGLSFERDIRPLFREEDREAMEFAFDLHAYDDVRENVDTILERIEDGSMPCDGEWPEEQVALFRAWIGEGLAP